MSSFTKSLALSPMENGKKWVLVESFSYYQDTNPESIITIPKDFETDFASIPRIFWIFLPPYQKLYGSPSILHDFLCVVNEQTKRKQKDHNNKDKIDGYILQEQEYLIWGKNENKFITINRKIADKLFLESMLVISKNKKQRFVAYMLYYFVRLYARILKIK